MALSEYEKQVLAQMEAQLKAADPSLASVMTSSMDAEPERTVQGSYSPRRIALGSIVGVSGLAVVLGGVSIGFGFPAVLLGVLGFLMMVGGVLWALKRDSVSPQQSRGGGTAAPKQAKGDFMERQRSRWEERGRG